MGADRAPEFALDAARRRGAVPRGGYRVVVLESSGELRVSDFGSLEGAQQYADDVAAESEDPSPLAYVFDHDLELVARGRHYAAPRLDEQGPRLAPMDQTARWIAYRDLDGPKVVRLSRGEWLIGRDVACAIVVRDLGCSRRHAKLVVGDDGVRIVDLKSKGGTQVASTPVTEAWLEDGDEVRLGTVRLQYVEGPPPDVVGGAVAEEE